MMRFVPYLLIASILGPMALAIDGKDMALRSSGTDSGNDWVLSENGYIGTYMTLLSPGLVTITVEASGQQTPHMNIVVADTSTRFDVTSGFNNYQHDFDLPAGTYVVRIEFNNDIPTAGRVLTIREVTITGAVVSNSSTNTGALAAADTYIEHFRQGLVNLELIGVPAGTPVHVELVEHAFMFGTAVGGFNLGQGSEWTRPNPPLGSNAYLLQKAIVALFNAIVPSNAGKWQQNEFSRDSLFYPVLQNMFNFAQAKDLRMRMHNLIWGNQQPSWVGTLLSQAAAGNMTAKNELRNEISERIDYYIGDGVGADWSDYYVEVDILNEAVHVPIYMDIFGADGIADIYLEALQAAATAGNTVRLYTNEYNVFQDSGDYYGNWFRRHIDELNNAGSGRVVTGIGVQCYENNAIGTSFDAHYPARKMQTLQNLSVLGLPISLTEFGVKGPREGHFTTEADAARMLDETMRIVFGTAQATAFFMWGFWQTDMFREGAAFYDANWNERQPLYAWQDLMAVWDTDLSLSVGAGSVVKFTGFYGDYEITVAGRTYDLTIEKGVTDYRIFVASPPGDFDFDFDGDLADFGVFQACHSGADGPYAPGCENKDFDGDGDVDQSDYALFHRCLSGPNIAADADCAS